ncbi:MAG: LptF/LptG family permease [Bacteroidota bacterium]|nr:LptF/LptG family permease [Kiloniellaceae bacterium]
MTVLAGYLTRLLLARFLLLLFGLTALLLGLDLMVNANSLLRDGAGVEALGRYAYLRMPMVISDLIKVAALLAGLITFAGLIRHSELTAIWGAGVSQTGLFRRLLPAALLLGGLQFAVDNLGVPAAAKALTEWGVGEYGRQQAAANSKTFTWIHAGPDVVRLRTAGIGAGGLSDFTIFQRDEEGNLLSRLDVAFARYDEGVWRLSGITVTGSDGAPPRLEAAREWDIALDPASLDHLTTHPRHLSFDQTRRFAGGDGQGTWAPYLYRTWLYEKLAACLVPLLLLLLSAALAQQTQRHGHVELLFLYGAATGFAFFIFNGVTLAMGEVGLLPPLFAISVPLVVLTAVAGSVIYWHELKRRPA